MLAFSISFLKHRGIKSLCFQKNARDAEKKLRKNLHSALIAEIIWREKEMKMILAF